MVIITVTVQLSVCHAQTHTSTVVCFRYKCAHTYIMSQSWHCQYCVPNRFRCCLYIRIIDSPTFYARTQTHNPHKQTDTVVVYFSHQLGSFAVECCLQYGECWIDSHSCGEKMDCSYGYESCCPAAKEITDNIHEFLNKCCEEFVTCDWLRSGISLYLQLNESITQQWIQ